ncbi:MAG: hypothetical protein VBE63_25990 [Lamprobacter sp.]|uniref:hypothetical protein n=1 Tax=Lamprobacter sp. TaxID=3100796 RepID=UPI002B26434C|nr:hypothetical protein [Lamprobacter sp.]MEA3643359.1 hypothetical protein [Lamprobacter sp.]
MSELTLIPKAYLQSRSRNGQVILAIHSVDCDHVSGYEFHLLPAKDITVANKLINFELHCKEGSWHWHLVPLEHWDSVLSPDQPQAVSA